MLLKKRREVGFLALVILVQQSEPLPIQKSEKGGTGDRERDREVGRKRFEALLVSKNWNSDLETINFGTPTVYSPNRIYFPDDLGQLYKGTSAPFPHENSLGREKEMMKAITRTRSKMEESGIVFRSFSDESERDSLEVERLRSELAGRRLESVFRLAYWSLCQGRLVHADPDWTALEDA